MKLLWCDDCHDVVALRVDRWRTCICGAVGGQYNYDGVTATIGGKGRVIGIGNPFLMLDWQSKTEKERNAIRKKYYTPGQKSDCWWGEYAGDQQLLRIEHAHGPRLITKSKVTPDGKQVVITVVDQRRVKVDGKYQKKVVIPNYADIQLTETPR